MCRRSSSLWALVLLSMILVSLLPSARAEQRLLCVHDVIAPDVLVARAAPTAQSRAVGSFAAGACGLQIVGPCADGYCEMALSGVRGWVDTRKVAVHDGPERPRAKPRSRAETTVEAGVRGGRCVSRVEQGDTLRIRTGPSPRHEEIGGIPPRTCGIEPVGGCQGSWCRIAWRGQVGWVNAYYLD